MANLLSLLRFVIWYWTIDTITLKMTEEYKPLIVGNDYSRLLQCIEDLRALILPVVEAHEARQAESMPVTEPQEARQGETLPVGEPQEVRPAKRTRTGLSVAEREAKEAFKLFKEKKRMEIYEFRMNYQGPPYQWSGSCGALCAGTMIVPWDTRLSATRLERTASWTRWRCGNSRRLT